MTPHDIFAAELVIVQCGTANAQRCLFRRHHERYDHVVLGSYHADDPVANELIVKFGDAVIEVPPGDITNTAAAIDERLTDEALDGKAPYGRREYAPPGKRRGVLLAVSYITRETVDDVMAFARIVRSPLARPYDRVVRCLGWQHNASIYSRGTEPLLIANKFPVLTHEYESVSVPGLFFAGTLGHGRDFRRSGGAVIQGFRYTARALTRILAVRRSQNQPGSPPTKEAVTPIGAWEASRIFSGVEQWDGIDVGPGVGAGQRWNTDAGSDGLVALLDHTFRRINRASGPYEMVSEIGDGIVFRCGHASSEAKGAPITAEYIEEIPVAYFNAKSVLVPILVFVCMLLFNDALLHACIDRCSHSTRARHSTVRSSVEDDRFNMLSCS